MPDTRASQWPSRVNSTDNLPIDPRPRTTSMQSDLYMSGAQGLAPAHGKLIQPRGYRHYSSDSNPFLLELESGSSTPAPEATPPLPTIPGALSLTASSSNGIYLRPGKLDNMTQKIVPRPFRLLTPVASIAMFEHLMDAGALNWLECLPSVTLFSWIFTTITTNHGTLARLFNLLITVPLFSGPFQSNSKERGRPYSA